MIRLPFSSHAPIGLDIGCKSVKLVQMTSDYSRIQESVCWDIATEPAQNDGSTSFSDEALVNALVQAREGRRFQGRDVVVCLNHQDLFLQNIRVERNETRSRDQVVQQEAAGRVPYSVTDAEIRYFDTSFANAGEARNSDLIIMACHRPSLDKRLKLLEQAGLTPVAVDVEPLAMVRSYVSQHRRESDREERVFYVHVGYTNSMVLIAEGDHILFVKYIEIGGADLDQAVASHLNMTLKEASSLRRHHGDRRKQKRDPEVTKSLMESTRTVIEKLFAELSMCVRYHSVTFRGKPLVRMMLTGGEASENLQENLGQRLGLECELGNPFRVYENSQVSGRSGQWDVACGLALRKAPDSEIYQKKAELVK